MRRLLVLAFVLCAVPVSAQTVKFCDEFPETVADTDLGSHTPDTDGDGVCSNVVGDSWSLLLASGTPTPSMKTYNTNNTAYATPGQNNGLVIYRMVTSSALGSKYTIRFKFSVTADSDAGTGIVLGWTDSSNYCSAFIYGTAAAGNDMFLSKRTTAGGYTNLAAADATITAGDTIYVHVDGNSITMDKGGSTLIGPITDSDCTPSSPTVGFGGGNFTSNTTDDITDLIEFDDIVVTDETPAGGSSGAINLLLRGVGE